VTDSAFDAALLQEVRLAESSWERAHIERSAPVRPLRTVPLGTLAEAGTLPVSAAGTLAVAEIVPPVGAPFFAVSLYARWEKPRVPSRWFVGCADAMAHRVLSDVSALIGTLDPRGHRILIAGDFNLIHGATDGNGLALPARDRSVFARLEALGFVFLGPQAPNGRQAVPVPDGLPADTGNGPTVRTNRQTAATATNQLDYVFASRGFHEQVRVWALNAIDAWGPSDHCRIAIDVACGDHPRR